MQLQSILLVALCVVVEFGQLHDTRLRLGQNAEPALVEGDLLGHVPWVPLVHHPLVAMAIGHEHPMDTDASPHRKRMVFLALQNTNQAYCDDRKKLLEFRQRMPYFEDLVEMNAILRQLLHLLQKDTPQHEA